MELRLKITLRELMKEKGLSLRKLSNLTGIRPSTLSGWINGVSPRDLGEVLTCAKYFGVSLEFLLFEQLSEATELESLLTDQVFEGYLKVKIEKVITKKTRR